MIKTIDHGPIRELRLDRPPVNALSPELVVALRDAIEASPAGGARAIVLSGSPGRFSGGLDVPLLLTLDRPAIEAMWRDFYSLLGAIAGSAIPIVAAITGHGPAGGTVLAIFCDYRIMAEGDYRLGMNEVRVGIPLPPAILAGLRRLVGRRTAEQLAVSGAVLSAQEAFKAGLVDEIVPQDRVVDHAIDWCKGLLALPPEAMTGTRRLARADLEAIFQTGIDAELKVVVAGWWSAETQSVLRMLAERLGKKVG